LLRWWWWWWWPVDVVGFGFGFGGALFYVRWTVDRAAAVSARYPYPRLFSYFFRFSAAVASSTRLLNVMIYRGRFLVAKAHG
jgi:hypothetical protein